MTTNPEVSLQRSKLPPGPSGKLRPTMGYARNPVKLFKGLQDKYGDSFVMHTMFGSWFVTADPEAIKTVYSADPAIYDSFLGDMLEAIAGKHSLVVIAGDRHRKERKLLMPHFQGDRMRSYGERIRQAALRRTAGWKAGDKIKMLDAMTEISLDVIFEIVFGVADETRRAQYRSAALARQNATTPVVLSFPKLRRNFGGIGPWAKFTRAANRLDALFLDDIAARRKSGAEHDDILHHMLQARYEDGEPMSDRAIMDELITLEVAGNETTAITLAWLFYWVHRLPEVKQKVMDELATLGAEPTPDAITALPYLDALIRETLRVTHPGTDVMRQLKQPLQLGEWELPAGMGINTCIPLLHRNPTLYPEPDVFRPERFLERKFGVHEFIGFGGGHRRCVGAAFAMYEIKLVFATLLPRFTMHLAKTTPLEMVRYNVFMAPAAGMPVVIDGRAG